MSAQFTNPSGIAIDKQSNLYVADQQNHRIRKITPAGIVTTLAGSSLGYADGSGTGAQFYRPVGVVVKPSAIPGTLPATVLTTPVAVVLRMT